MSFSRSLCGLALALLPSLALAHHGQDFLIVESPSIPHPGQVYLIANADAALDGDAEQQAGFEPALLFSVSPRVAFELHAHTEKLAGESWRYEATAPAVHLLLTDPHRHDGLKVGLSAEYEIAAHAGDADNAEVRLAFEDNRDADKWAANLIASREQGGDSDFGAALGFRHQLRDSFALGIEGQGSFRHAEGGEVLFAGYYEHAQAFALKFGIGGERSEDSDCVPMLRVGLVLRLRDDRD
jgi:hypothetical protein